MKLKFTFLITALLLLGSLTMWGQTQTTSITIASGVEKGGTLQDILSWTCQQNSCSNTPAYNNDGTLRFYYNSSGNGCGMTITPVPGIIITGVTLTAKSDSYTPVVKYKIDGGGDVQGTWNGTTMSITNISASTTFEFRNANTSNTQLRLTGSIDITYTASGPTQLTAPTDFSGTPGNAQIAFSWTAVEHASSYNISYTPEGGNETIIVVEDGTATTYTLTGLTNGTSYSCKIQAVGDGTTYSNSGYTTAIPVTPTDATFYTITLNESAGGTITCDKATAEAGETITLTATPNTNYGFTSWYAIDGDANEITVTDNKFTMPASDVEVEATFTAYTISATSNNSSWGTVELSGNVITATAATGCRLANPSYTVTEGTATVTQNDNAFTVVATSDCTVQINFEAIPTHTVTLDPGTGSVSPTSLTGATVDLSTLTVTSPTGWTFYGWAIDEVVATQTTPTIISGIYTPTDNITLYAVYSKSEGSEPASTTTSYSNPNSDWTVVENGGGSDYWQLFNQNSNYITSPTIDISTITSIEVRIRTYGISSEESKILYVYNMSASADMATKSATSTMTTYTFDASDLNNKTGNGKVKFYSGHTGTTNIGLRVEFVTINYQAAAYTYNTNPAANGPCATPTFSLAEGYYYTAQSVELSCETPGATIRYTIDGTEPTAESTVYGTEPIAVSATTTIKAKAYCSGYDPSEIATATYNFMPDVAGTYVIAYKEGENYYAMSQTANEYGTKLTSQAVTLNGVGKVVTSVNGGLLWTIDNTTSGVAIKPINDENNYLNIVNSTLTIGTTQDYFQVISRLEEVYSFKDMTSNYAVQYYNGFFTSYSYSENDPFNFYLLPYELPTTYTVSIAEGISNGSISSVTSASEDDEITVTVNPNSGYKLSTLYYYTTDPATTTAIDQSTRTFIMPAANVTIEATFTLIPTWNVTLYENGSQSSISQLEGSYTLPVVVAPDGYTFVGWSASEVSVTNTAPEMLPTVIELSSNLALYAVYAIRNVSSNCTWDLVSGATTLAAGDRFMLYGQKSDGTKNSVAGGLSSSVLTAISVSAPVNNQISQPDGAEIFTLAAGQDGKWVFVSHDGKYLRTGVSYSETSSTEWTITIDSEDGDAVISDGTNYLDFNAGAPRFKTYGSSQGYTALYRYTQESALMNYSTNITALSGTLTTQTYNTNCYISGATTIPTGVTVTCNYGLGNTNAANLIIKDGGQLIINNSGVMATVEKDIDAWTTSPVGGWYTIASPVANQTIGESFTPTGDNNDYDMYRYDEATAQWFNQKDTENQLFAHSTFQVGTGYLVAYEQGGTKQFVGELNTSASVDLTSTVGELQGFNLIANPYTHNIYKGAGAAIDHANLSDGFYVMNNHGSWLASNFGDAIAPCQSVLVKATSAIENFAIVKKTDEATGEGSSKARSAEGFIQIEVSNETYMDRAFVNFGQGSGLSKIHHLNVSAPMLYIPQDGKDYAIAVMSSAKENLQELPVCFTTGERGSYTICAKPQNLEFTYLHLIDNLTGADINLLEQNSYTFVAGTNDYASRFKLVFNPIENGSTVGENFAFFNNGNLVINGIEEGATLQLIDVQGRILSTEILSGSYNQSLNVKSGVYVVRLIEGSKVRIQKLVVE